MVLVSAELVKTRSSSWGSWGGVVLVSAELVKTWSGGWFGR